MSWGNHDSSCNALKCSISTSCILVFDQICRSNPPSLPSPLFCVCVHTVFIFSQHFLCNFLKEIIISVLYVLDVWIVWISASFGWDTSSAAFPGFNKKILVLSLASDLIFYRCCWGLGNIQSIMNAICQTVWFSIWHREDRDGGCRFHLQPLGMLQIRKLIRRHKVKGRPVELVMLHLFLTRNHFSTVAPTPAPISNIQIKPPRPDPVLSFPSLPPSPVRVKRVWGNLRECGSFPCPFPFSHSQARLGIIRLNWANESRWMSDRCWRGAAVCVRACACASKLQNHTCAWPTDPGVTIATRSSQTQGELMLRSFPGTYSVWY